MNQSDNHPTWAEQVSPKTAWQQFSDFLTAPHASIKEISQQKRARLTAGLILIILVLSLVGGLAGQVESRPYQLALFVIALFAYVLSRGRFFSFGGFIFVLALSATPFITILVRADGIIAPRIYAWLPLAVVIASVLVNRWALFLFTGLLSGAIVALNLFYPDQGQTIGQAAGIVASLGILLIYLENFRIEIEKVRLSELTQANKELATISQLLEERVAERTAQLDRKTSQLEASAMVARSAAETTDIRELLDIVVSQISHRFGFYHTGIFLSDSSRQKVYLAAASSEGGKRLLARGHSLNIGREGVVGYAAYEKRPRVAQDIDRENVYFRNPELPDTRSEAALPLVIKNQAIGVLDIQSTEESPFSAEDLFILQTMADQIALAIQNARLLDESRSALEQLQSITTHAIQDAWRSYAGQRHPGYVYSSGDVVPISESKPGLDEKESRALEVGIVLRGQRIGVINLKRSASQTDWTEKEQDFTEKIASQLALAIENARLLEESQRRAAREQTLNELTTRLSRSLDLETLLQNAVLELHKLPQVTDASVMITPQEMRKQP
jgi:GAF domain-containing protein